MSARHDPVRGTVIFPAGALLLVAFEATACADKACTATTPGPSTVRVVDRDGATVPDAKVFRRVPGSADVRLGCGAAGSDVCDSRSVELPGGTWTLLATRADGSSGVEKTVTIVDTSTAECPAPQPQQITLVVDP